MKRAICVLLFGFALAGCEATRPPPQTVQLQVTALSEDEIAWSRARGRNSVVGFALLRDRGNRLYTCAAETVYLIPDSAYARERMRAFFGSGDKGSRDPMAAQLTIIPNLPLYHASMRRTVCDARGNFRFDDIPDGTWAVVTEVSWPLGSTIQGEYFMERVTLRGGEVRRVAFN